MKKQLFLGLAAITSVASVAQQTLKKAPVNAVARKVNVNKGIPSTYEPAFVTPSKKQGPLSTQGAPYKRIGGSVNNLGVIVSESRCLQYNAAINTVGLAYRQNDATWTGIPNGNSGTIAYAWSSNNGGTWDSTIMAASSSYLHRYPAGTMYNPSANTNPSNAYAVVAGPWHPGQDWQGNYFASKQLTAPGTNTNNTVTYVDNNALQPGQVKQDFVRVDPQFTADGAIHIMGTLYENANATTVAGQGWRGITLNKGMFSAGTFTWSVDSLKPSFKANTSGDSQRFATTNMAWSESGQIGYVAFYGIDANAQPGTPANSYQPYVYKTTDAGATWSRYMPLYDFSSIPSISSRLFATRGTTVTGLGKPFIGPGEGGSATVDAAGNLHLFLTMGSAFSDHIDSLGYTYATNYNSVWDYLVDVKTTSTGWDAVVIDSLSCAGTGTLTNWSGASPEYDARLQISRTADGKNIFYSWADSDSTLTASEGVEFTHVSRFPEIYQIGYDVILDKFTCKKNMTAGKTGVDKQAFFFYASPIVAKPTGSTFQIPTSFVKSDDGSKNGDIAISQYYLDDNMFTATEFTVTPNTVGCVAHSGVGINEAASAVSNLSFYPNPTSANGTISLSLTESAKVNVAVLNAVGQTVYSTSMTANAGTNKLEVNLSNLSAGLYFYQVQVANKKAVTQKFVIEK